MTPINLVLLGDQTVEKLSSIQSLVRHSKHSAGAKRFLQEATDAVQLNFDRLSKEERAWNHEISTLLGLAEDNIAEEKPNGLIATVLMLIGRLGELIVYAEEDSTILGSEDEPVHILAFCTGLLPGAALAAAKDTNDLFTIGKELISIIFRMINEITNRMMLIEETYQSWAYSVVGKTPEQVQPILDDFHAKLNIPYAKRVAIGVVSTGWLTLMGAPSSINKLMEFSKELEEAPKTKTDTNGAVHTTFIPTFDVDKVLGDSPILDTPISSKMKMLSPATCEPYKHDTLRSLLAEIMVDIAHNILRISDTAETVVAGLAAQERPVVMTVGGPTGHLTAVQRILQSKNVKFSLREHKEPKIDELSRGGSDLVAIVGMSGRFPGSETVEGFFEDLLESKIQIKKIPKSRFDLDTFYDPTGEKRNTTSTEWGAFMDRPGYFDNRLFNVSPREALSMDPLQRLLLTTSYEALEMAGYSKDATLATDSNRIAVYYGQAAEDWSEVMNESGIDLYYIPGMNRAFGPSRISYHHKWGGGTYALDAACASSSTAIQLACAALKARECDTALAGGGSLLVTPNLFAGLSRSGMISDNGGCRTFHDDADGYCRGEGVGVIVLKRLEDALADNDNILGVIRGSARMYSNTSTSITHPSADAQSRIYEDVLRQSSVSPNEVAYVEMHGTGTQAGDFEEMTSVLRILGKGRSKDNALTVGAVKANLAHGEGVAGVTSLIKVLMMLRERSVPPQPGLPFKLNHKLPKLDKLHVRIAGLAGKQTLTASPASANGKVKCIVNTFDASGGNTSLLIEEAPEPMKKNENPLPAHVITLSARTKASLQGNRRRLLDYLVRNPSTKLADLSYTTTARRLHETLRVAYVGKTTKDIVQALRADDGSNDPKNKPPPSNLVFAFTGQGSQYAGMGQQLYQHSIVLRELLHTYQHLAKHSGLPDFLHLISSKDDISKASPTQVQLAVVALEIATANLLKIWGLKPAMVIGHSLGEYSALCIAGVLSVSDTLLLVGRRAQLMTEQLKIGEYSMLAVGKDRASVQQLISSKPAISVACLNGPELTVVSGPTTEIESFKTSIESSGGRATLLKVPYGFHSQHIDPVLAEYEKLASTVIFSAPTTPVASTLLGKIVQPGENTFSASYLARQARQPVDFVGALKSIDIAQPCFIEVGPEPVCIGLVRRTLDIPSARLLATMKSSEDNWVSMSSALAGLYRLAAPVNWPQYFKEFKTSVTLLNLPTYAFDEKDFWTPYVEYVDPNAVKTSPAVAALPAAPVSSFSTTSLQRVKSEKIESGKVSVTFGTNTAEPTLYTAIRGHIVNDIHICSLSIFSDMAKSAAHYAHEKLKPGKIPSMNIYDVNLTRALIVPNVDPTQVVTTKVEYSSNTALVSFQSESQGKHVEHGSMKVAFENNKSHFSSLLQNKFLVETRIATLKEQANNGSAHRMLKPIFYKLFDNLVQYDTPYQGVDEIWVDAGCRDAVGTVTMPDTSKSGNYMYNPFWMDAGIQISGFLLNSGLTLPDDMACFATGFQQWKVLEEFEAGKSYTSYISVHSTGGNAYSAEAYVFNDRGDLMQTTSGIHFLKMKRSVLTHVLDPSGAETRPKSMPAPVERHFQPTAKQPGSGTSTPEEFEPSGTTTPVSMISTAASSISEGHGSKHMQTLLSVVAQESGCSIDDLEDGAAFGDVGMDSLMAITVVAAFLKKTGIELPATFFLDNVTVKDARAALQEDDDEPAAPQHEQVKEVPVVQPTLSAPEDVKPVETAPVEVKAEPASTQSVPAPAVTSKAILLQGSPTSTGPKVFFFPEGSGTLGQYIQIPALGKDVTVWGVESPFIKTPADFTCSVEEICASFTAGMKSVQPKGPYLLGGYSFGAIYAQEIARDLLRSGDAVDALFILDMAVPGTAPAGISTDYAALQEAGIVPSTGRRTASQKEHISRTVQAMLKHTVKPLSQQAPKNTVLITSKTGLAADKQSALAKWLRNDSTARGWKQYISSVQEVTVDDADHFNLLRQPHVEKLGQVCMETVAKS